MMRLSPIGRLQSSTEPSELFEDITRCCLVQVGNFNELWPMAIRYAATASTISKWKELPGHEFESLHIPFGALIQYKPSVAKSKLGAKTSAGLFLGWRIGAGIHWKRTYLLCDVENVKSWFERESRSSSFDFNGCCANW